MTYHRSHVPTNARSERWKREDDAPRLHDEVPHLAALRLNLEERRDDNAIAGTRHSLHVVVGRASALFEVPCGDPKCEDGGHDISATVLEGLFARLPRIEGTNECRGYVGDHSCNRTLRYEALPSYTSSDS